jgi:hypothetical protein
LLLALTTAIDAGDPAVPVAVNVAGVATPEVEAVKLLLPAVVLKVGVHEAMPLEFVVEEEQPETEAPVVVVAQVTAMPDPTAFPLESLTRA